MVLHVLAWDARMVPVDLAYVIFIDFLALGVLGFCFLLLSNVQFLVLVNLPPGRSHAGGISSRHSRRRYPTLVASPGGPTLFYSRPIECVACLGRGFDGLGRISHFRNETS